MMSDRHQGLKKVSDVILQVQTFGMPNQCRRPIADATNASESCLE
jgi:hypothetical protein